MKVPFMGAFYASFVFDETIAIDEAHFFLSLWDRLTYHELCVLAYFADDEHAEYRLHLQAAADEEGVAMTHMLAAELTQLTGLGLVGVRLPDGSVTEFGATAGTVGSGGGVLMRALGSLAPTELGEAFVRMAELEQIPDADKQEVGGQLRGKVD